MPEKRNKMSSKMNNDSLNTKKDLQTTTGFNKMIIDLKGVSTEFKEILSQQMAQDHRGTSLKMKTNTGRKI